MSTNIVIDEDLLKEAMAVSGNRSRKATVEEALRIFIRFKSQDSIRSLRGKLHWEGNLDAMR